MEKISRERRKTLAFAALAGILGFREKIPLIFGKTEDKQMSKNQEYKEIEITGYTHEGVGVGRIEY